MQPVHCIKGVQAMERRSVEVQKRSGRPRKSNEKMDRVIWRMSKKDHFKSANLIKSCLLKHYGLSLSSRTVRHRLNEGGLFGRSAQKKPFISLHNRHRRLEWAKHVHFSVEDWKNVLFSDENKFVRVHSSGRVYVQRLIFSSFIYIEIYIYRIILKYT